MSYLSKNFTSKELACKCGKCQFFIDPMLVKALQELRDLAGSPIKVLSGYRCVSHNKAVGGSKLSQHIYGRAADIAIEGNTVEEMAQLAAQVSEFHHGGIGIYPDKKFVHVDVRQGTARWAEVKGKMTTFNKGLDYFDKMKGKKK